MVEPIRYTGHRGPIYCLAQGPAPGTFLSASGDGRVVLWHTDRPEAGEVLVNVTFAVFSLCLLAGTGLLLIGTEGGALHVVDLASRREVRLFEVHERGLFRMLALPDERIVCAGGDGSLSIWATGSKGSLGFQRQIPVVEEKLRDLALSPDGSQLAVACGDGTVRVFDTTLFNELFTLDAHPAPIGTPIVQGASSVAYHPTKPVLLSAGKDGHLRSWRTDEDHALLHAAPIHKGTVYRMAFSPDGTRLATAGRDKCAKVWDADTLEPRARLDRAAGGHTHSVNDVLWCDRLLLTASDDRHILAWPQLP